MSDVAVSTTHSPAGPAQLLTWRDAVTPLSRSSRRRWTLAYALLLVLGGVLAAFPDALLSLWGPDAGAEGAPEDRTGNAVSRCS